MGRQRHKRKNSHVVIVTSDSVDVGMKQFRIRPWVLQMIIFILCLEIIVQTVYVFVICKEGSRNNQKRFLDLMYLESQIAIWCYTGAWIRI